MNLAIKESMKALKKGEMPVGAIIVKDGRIISRGYNKKEKSKCALNHAELIAIRKACKKINNWRLEGCTMYVTLEPCNMCMGAIIECRIKKIVCGVENRKSNKYNKLIAKENNISISYGLYKNIIYKNITNFFQHIRCRTFVR